MTTLFNLPEELLQSILKYLKPEDLKECQYTCQAMYSSARSILLKEIKLPCFTAVERFMLSFDNTSDFDAVETLSIGNLKSSATYKLEKEQIKKLFCRFPNLKKVSIYDNFDVFSEFDDDLCKDILSSCPKLNKFEVDTDAEKFTHLIYNVRLLLTSIDLQCIAGTVDNIQIQFPRLQEIITNHYRLQDALPMIEKFPNLKSVSFSLIEGNDKPQHYLDGKSIKEQEALLKILAGISELDSYIGDSPEATRFLFKYMTGVKSVQLRFMGIFGFTETFKNDILDYVCSAKRGCISLRSVLVSDLVECFPTILEKAFHQTASLYNGTPNRVLRFNITNWVTRDRDIFDLGVILDRNQCERRIGVRIWAAYSLQDIAETFGMQDNHAGHVDVLILDIQKYYYLQYFTHETTVEMYDRLLGWIPTLKEVVLDVPASFKEGAPSDTATVLSLVEKLTLRAGKNTKIQSLLDHFSYVFPNLKRLNLCYFSGIWKSDLGEFQVALTEYSLEKLCIDVTPVKNIMMKKAELSEQDFFVVKLKLQGDEEQYLYKITFDFLFITNIDYRDLRGPVQGEDYVCVNVVVKNLQNLEVLMRDEDEHEDADADKYYDDSDDSDDDSDLEDEDFDDGLKDKDEDDGINDAYHFHKPANLRRLTVFNRA